MCGSMVAALPRSYGLRTQLRRERGGREEKKKERKKKKKKEGKKLHSCR